MESLHITLKLAPKAIQPNISSRIKTLMVLKVSLWPSEADPLFGNLAIVHFSTLKGTPWVIGPETYGWGRRGGEERESKAAGAYFDCVDAG